MKIAIYLAGSIKKGHEKADESYWAEEDMTLLKKRIISYEIAFLNPAFRTDDLSDNHSLFGRDMLQVFSSHLVFVDARNRRGLGVGAEMMWAKINKIPVISWVPQNTHYRKEQTRILDIPIENFIHPFVESLSDRIVSDLEEGAKAIQELLSNSHPIKGIEHIGAAMQHYKTSQLPHDAPMRELLLLSKELEKRSQRNIPQLVS